MPLQTSGAISLNDIHLEVGGSSGTSASLNDADVRGLIGKSSGATSSFSEFYGASAFSPYTFYTDTSINFVSNDSKNNIAEWIYFFRNTPEYTKAFGSNDVNTTLFRSNTLDNNWATNPNAANFIPAVKVRWQGNTYNGYNITLRFGKWNGYFTGLNGGSSSLNPEFNNSRYIRIDWQQTFTDPYYNTVWKNIYSWSNGGYSTYFQGETAYFGFWPWTEQGMWGVSWSAVQINPYPEGKHWLLSRYNGNSVPQVGQNMYAYAPSTSSATNHRLKIYIAEPNNNMVTVHGPNGY